MKLLGLSLVAGTQFHFFIDFAYFRGKVYFKEMCWMAAPTQDFHLFDFNITAFTGIH